jgi:hypothetical protein
MARFLILAILSLIAASRAALLEASDDNELVRQIDTLSRQAHCHLAMRKVFAADTDRGTEASMYDCTEPVQRIEVTFGLSRKDVIINYVLLKGQVAKVDIVERKYRSTTDAVLDFSRPLPRRLVGRVYFQGPKLLSIESGETLNITKQNKNAKAASFINLVNALRAALASSDAHPEFESISFLTGIFGNG